MGQLDSRLRELANELYQGLRFEPEDLMPRYDFLIS